MSLWRSVSAVRKKGGGGGGGKRDRELASGYSDSITLLATLMAVWVRENVWAAQWTVREGEVGRVAGGWRGRWAGWPVGGGGGRWAGWRGRLAVWPGEGWRGRLAG